MKRRALLAAIGTATAAGCLGSASEGSSNESGSDNTSDSRSDDRDDSADESVDPLSDQLPDERVYDFDNPIEYDVVLIEAKALYWRSSVEYTDHESAGIKEWDPGEEMNVVVVDLGVENLSDERLDYPSWDRFKLVTPEGEHDPVLETPGGTSVENIRDPLVSWPGSSGLRASYRRGWSNVYAAPAYDIENYAIKWDRPEDPIYWRPRP